MEDQSLKECCDRIIENMYAELYEDKHCIAAYLLGSASHDKIWEWSDIQIAVILDDGYKGKMYYTLFEEGTFHAQTVRVLRIIMAGNVFVYWNIQIEFFGGKSYPFLSTQE